MVISCSYINSSFPLIPSFPIKNVKRLTSLLKHGVLNHGVPRTEHKVQDDPPHDLDEQI